MAISSRMLIVRDSRGFKFSTGNVYVPWFEVNITVI